MFIKNVYVYYNYISLLNITFYGKRHRFQGKLSDPLLLPHIRINLEYGYVFTVQIHLL